MSRLRLLVVTLAVAAIVAGCRKSDPTPTAGPAVPDDSSNGPPEKRGKGNKDGRKAGTVSDRDVPMDLSRYLVRGEIAVPEGTTVNRKPGGGCVLQSDEAFRIEVGRPGQSLADVKANWAGQKAKWVRDEPAVLLAEFPDKGHAIDARVKLGDLEYRLATPTGIYFTREQAERMLKSALSLKQTDAIQASMKREGATREQLKAAGCTIVESVDWWSLSLEGDKVNDDILIAAKELTGLHTLALAGAPKVTAKGIAHLATAPALEQLILTGPDTTDELVAPLRAAVGLTYVAMSNHGLTDAGLAFLASLSNLHELLLIGSPTPRASARIKGEGFAHLKGLKSLTKVTLNGEPIDDIGMEHLGAVKSLRELSLNRLRVTDVGIGHLAGLTKLERVSLTRLPIRGSGLSAFSTLPELQMLDLTGSALIDSYMDRLRGARVTELNLSNTGISDNGLKSIPDLSKLQVLNLKGTRVTDAGLVHLACAPALREISLDHTGIGGAGFAHFKARAELRSLSANYTAVSDAALAELPGCPNLAKLALVGTPVTDAGLDNLQTVLSLEAVDLHETDVTSAAVDRFKTARPKAVLEWTSPVAAGEPKTVLPPVPVDKLRSADPNALVKKYEGSIKTDDEEPGKPVIAVGLAGSAVTDEELANLRGLKSLQTLDLTGCKNVSDAGLAYLTTLLELRTLRLRGTGVTGDGLAHLKGLSALTTLELPSAGMTLKQLAPVGALKSLEHLSITPPPEHDAYLAFMSGFPRLKEINLKDISPTPRRLATVGKLTGLERLDLESDHVDDRGLSYLKGLTNLKELRLSSELASDAGLQHLGGLTGLKVLELRGSRFTDLGFQHLRNLVELERLQVRGTGLSTGGLVHVQPFIKLIELDLKEAEVADSGLQRLTDLKELELIDLSSTLVTDEGLKHFKGLEELRTLRLEDTRVTGKGFVAIKRLPRLARLHLSRSQVNDDGLAAIAQVESIEQLELDGSAITDTGLARLKVLPNLKQLKLNRVARITDKSIDVLKQFPALTEVFARDSGLSAKAIADLKKKEGLTVYTE
jgi:Leucine-rich repeat (LRR) protein